MAMYYVGDRQTGKSERLLTWVAEGEETFIYPGHSRIILTATEQEATRLRKTLKERHPEKDTYRWVFSLYDWKDAVIGHPPPEIGVDNANWILEGLLNCRVTVATINGVNWTTK